MPGSGVCGRCGTSLRLGADVSVAPPRAGSVALATRRWTSYHTWRRRLRDGLSAVVSTEPAERAGHRGPRLRLRLGGMLAAMRDRGGGLPDTVGVGQVLARAIVPGWPQWFVGQRWQGALFLLAYLALAIPGVIDVLNAGPGVLLGFAFAVHAASIVDMVQQAWHEDPLPVRFARSLVTALVTITVVYGVPTLILARYAMPSYIAYNAGQTFVAGDVVLINSRGHADVGDVVVFQLGRTEYASEAGGHRRYAYDGAVIDRVLAGPGDRVACARGVLSVNGRPARWFPLNPTYRLRDFNDLIVPADAVFILPTNVPDRMADAVARRSGIVGRADVSGVVWYRVSPWRRAGLIY